MNSEPGGHFQRAAAGLRLDDPQQAAQVVQAILSAAVDAGASDVHLVPGRDALKMQWRIDGVLQPVAEFPRTIAPNIAARLKVLADLLTYRTEVPQEGRIREGSGGVEMRVSTFPTLYGEKAVVRLFGGSDRFRTLDELGLPDDIVASVRAALLERGGLLLVTGPAGSGKTTTVYAALRELVQRESGRSLVSIEDPVESVIEGAAQSQVQPAAGFTYESGLRSLLRQDPDVILVGEIRDRETAEMVFQASLTGHLVLTTFHAGSAAEAVSRCLDMEIEPYLVRSGVLGIASQRLVRRLCTCAAESDADADCQALDVERVWRPVGCERCGGSGYAGRMVLAEMLRPDEPQVGRAILERADAAAIQALAVQAGMVSAWDRGVQAIGQGLTSPAEIRRVFGLRAGHKSSNNS